MRIFGLILIAVAALVPLVWYYPLFATRDPGALFSQYLGSAALILMGINMLLATRFWGMEAVFGSLDRIYVLHKWLAIIALVAMGLHDIIDAEMNGLREGPLSDIAEEFGEVGFYGLMILIIVSVITFVPYHLWKWTHRIIGVFFALSAFHYFFIAKPFSNGDPLGLYISAFCIVGLLSYAWASLVRPATRGGQAYVVEQVSRLGDVSEVVLKAKGRGLKHKPGQFAFVQFKGHGLGEEHPFTLSGGKPDGSELRFSIKVLGDYTRRLHKNIEVGMDASVSGPHGHFTQPTGRDPQVWIGAGIGITPFLAMAQQLQTAKSKSGSITLYYCVGGRDGAPYVTELEALASENSNFELVIVDSSNGTRLTSEQINAGLGAGIKKAHIFFCGPVAMRKQLRTELTAKGVRASRFHFEEFQMRTGVGLEALAAWLLRRSLDAVAKRRAG